MRCSRRRAAALARPTVRETAAARHAIATTSGATAMMAGEIETMTRTIAAMKKANVPIAIATTIDPRRAERTAIAATMT